MCVGIILRRHYIVNSPLFWCEKERSSVVKQVIMEEASHLTKVPEVMPLSACATQESCNSVSATVPKVLGPRWMRAPEPTICYPTLINLVSSRDCHEPLVVATIVIARRSTNGYSVAITTKVSNFNQSPWIWVKRWIWFETASRSESPSKQWSISMPVGLLTLKAHSWVLIWSIALELIFHSGQRLDFLQHRG